MKMSPTPFILTFIFIVTDPIQTQLLPVVVQRLGKGVELPS